MGFTVFLSVTFFESDDEYEWWSFVVVLTLFPFLCRVKKMSAGDIEGKQEWFSVPVPPSSNTTLQVSDLSPATEYQFSILSQNKFGTGPFSEIVTTRTLGQYHLPVSSLELLYLVRDRVGPAADFAVIQSSNSDLSFFCYFRVKSKWVVCRCFPYSILKANI